MNKTAKVQQVSAQNTYRGQSAIGRGYLWKKVLMLVGFPNHNQQYLINIDNDLETIYLTNFVTC